MKFDFPTNPETIASPVLLICPDVVAWNLDRMIAMVDGKTEHLRPHVKTHKLAEIVAMQLVRGISKTKCATIAEAEMCARAGSTDVMLAYPPVGPNIERFIELVRTFPEVKFSAVCDSVDVAGAIAEVFSAAGKTASLFIDLNNGMNRTGISPGEEALALVKFITKTDGMVFAGVHAYDGHIHDASSESRNVEFDEAFSLVRLFIEQLHPEGIEIETLVTGGSPTMELHAKQAVGENFPFAYECSAGTPALWDAGYQSKYPEMGFAWAAALMTRVISKPGAAGENLLCLDLGHKAVAAENPLENRLRFPDFPDAEFVQQSEEHLVIRIGDASAQNVGDVLFAIPWHICPTVALHQEAVVVRNGEATGERWKIEARDRRLTI